MERGKLPEIPVPAWPQTATARLTNHPLSNREFLEVPIMQSVGLPSRAKRYFASLRRRNGRCSVSEWPAPLCSISGATTQTSLESSRAIRSSVYRPEERIPSSFASSMHALLRSSGGLELMRSRRWRCDRARSCRAIELPEERLSRFPVDSSPAPRLACDRLQDRNR